MSHILSIVEKREGLHCLTEKTGREDARYRVFFAPPISWHGMILSVSYKAMQVMESRV